MRRTSSDLPSEPSSDPRPEARDHAAVETQAQPFPQPDPQMETPPLDVSTTLTPATKNRRPDTPTVASTTRPIHRMIFKTPRAHLPTLANP